MLRDFFFLTILWNWANSWRHQVSQPSQGALSRNLCLCSCTYQPIFLSEPPINHFHTHNLRKPDKKKRERFSLARRFCLFLPTWILLFRAYCNTPSNFSPLNCRKSIRSARPSWVVQTVLNTLHRMCCGCQTGYLKICCKWRRVHSTRGDGDDFGVRRRFLQQRKHQLCHCVCPKYIHREVQLESETNRRPNMEYKTRVKWSCGMLKKRW